MVAMILNICDSSTLQEPVVGQRSDETPVCSVSSINKQVVNNASMMSLQDFLVPNCLLDSV